MTQTSEVQAPTLERLLKAMLRAYGIRVVSIEAVNPSAPPQVDAGEET